MDDRLITKTIKTHKFSTKKLQSILSENVCNTLQFDILNLGYDKNEYHSFLNHDCRILKHKELVESYAKSHGEEIGNTLRTIICNIFSHDELEKSYISGDHTQIYKKLYEHFKKKIDGNTLTNDVILMMLEYRLEGYKQEEQTDRIDF